jgi:hypothetical protein
MGRPELWMQSLRELTALVDMSLGAFSPSLAVSLYFRNVSDVTENDLLVSCQVYGKIGIYFSLFYISNNSFAAL